MKKILLFSAFCFFTRLVQAQDYLDVLKLSYGNATLGNVDNNNETAVSSTLVDFLYPIPVTAKTVIVGGFTYENTRLGLGHDDSVRSNLIMTRLNVGIKQTHGNGWTGTYVALPKIASDFEDLGGDDYQFGGIALLEKRYTSKYGLKFGAYVSGENFGTTITPLVGVWYKSDNNKFYVNAVLPIRADANYSITDKWSAGANLLTSIKSYNLSGSTTPLYVQEESIRFALFTSYGFLDDTLILRAKIGLDTTDYGVYAQGDTVGAQLLTFQLNGDQRSRLNSEFASAAFFGLDLIYRLDL